MLYLTGKSLLNTDFQACTSGALDPKPLFHQFLCTPFAQESSFFVGEADSPLSTQTLTCTSFILWQLMQLPAHFGSMSNQVLQRGQFMPVDCPDGGLKGQWQWGQTSRLRRLSIYV